ncbi:MAG: hypothetical protein QN120_14660 [Armatimonadota bacterium]|nr:hypothetical protein [Armatimonadota bacterium]
MARFSGRALGHAALLLVVALVAAACGTTQTAQAPTPSPSPSPPGGTVTVSGKVLVTGTVLPNPPAVQGNPANDGTVVGYWVTSTLPAGSPTARLEAVLDAVRNQQRRGTAAAAAEKMLAQLAQLKDRAQRLGRIGPSITYPITAAPAQTTTTQGGEYTFNVPASLIGQQITICVLGPNVTGAVNPGDPTIVGACGTMTVMANQGGSTAINRMSFVLPQQQTGFYVLTLASNIFGGTPLGQTTPIQLVTIANLTAADNAFIRSRLAVGMDPRLYNQASPYAGTGPGVAKALRIVSSVSGTTFTYRGVVQWRSDSSRNAAYQIDFTGAWDVTGPAGADDFVDGGNGCEWDGAETGTNDPGVAPNGAARAAQLAASGLTPDTSPWIVLATNIFTIITPTTQAGEFVFPNFIRPHCVGFLVAQDTAPPTFAAAPVPESVPAAPGGLGNWSRTAPNYVWIPFSEPAMAARPLGAGGSLDDPAEWTRFVPANDQNDGQKAAAVPGLWDAHVGAYVAPGAQHNDLSGQPDAITGVRVPVACAETLGPGAGVSELVCGSADDGKSVRTDWDAQFGDWWFTVWSPVSFSDLAGNTVSPGPSLRIFGVVVP